MGAVDGAVDQVEVLSGGLNVVVALMFWGERVGVVERGHVKSPGLFLPKGDAPVPHRHKQSRSARTSPNA